MTFMVAGAAHDRYPGFADLDRALEPVEFAAQASIEGRAWIAALPALLDRPCRRWRLQVEDGVVARGYHGVVVPVRHGAERYVLKLSWPAERAAEEARALAAWRGQGAVLLLEADAAVGALLLERLEATRTLESLELRAAAEVAGRLLRRLAIPAPEGVRPLRVVTAAIEASLHERQERLGRPVPEGWLAIAGSLAHELGARAGEVDELKDAAAIRRLLAVLAGSGGLDGEKARGWAIVRCVDYWLWGLENGLTEDPKRCRRVLAALV